MSIKEFAACILLVSMMGMCMWMYAVQWAESLPPHPSEAVVVTG